ncbi:MAG: hypothetical protein K4H23_05445 [Mollicutes bacterium PWAP]|nr:hypothetical protein [Mollicutes bacterium PWAP]
MGTILMWGILGGLITIVAGILIVMMVLDKKKKKQQRLATIFKQKIDNESPGQVVLWINQIFIENEKELIKFVPGSGGTKMSQINMSARNSYKRLQKQIFYKRTKQNNEYKEFIRDIEKVFKNNASTWKNKNIEEYKKIYKFSKSLDKDAYSEIKQIIVKEVKNSYDIFIKNKNKLENNNIGQEYEIKKAFEENIILGNTKKEIKINSKKLKEQRKSNPELVKESKIKQKKMIAEAKMDEKRKRKKDK